MENKIILSDESILKKYSDKSKVVKKYFYADDISPETLKEKIENSERIAEMMANAGINAVTAIKNDGGYVREDDDGIFTIYPWIDGYTLERNMINEDICFQIGRIIGKMHKLELKNDAVRTKKSSQYALDNSSQQIIVTKKASQYALDNSKQQIKKIIENLPIIHSIENDIINDSVKILEQYYQNIYMLAQSDKRLRESDRNILCHRDTVIGNFIVCKGEYYIIDWEHAGYEYPEFELFDTCLEWSGYWEKTDWKLYKKITEGYYSEMPYKKNIPYEDIYNRMIFSILNRIGSLLTCYKENVVYTDRELIKKLDSYNNQIKELSRNKELYLDCIIFGC